MKFEKAYTVGAREIGISNKLTNYGMLAFFEDVASNHSDSVGYGVKDISTKKRAWILMDWKLEVIKRPSFGEKIYVKTWATEIEKTTYHVYRNFEMYDEEKNLVSTATSKWVFYDIENNRIAKIDNSIISLYHPEGSSRISEEKIEKIKSPISFDSIYEYKVKRADIDINNHMHNLNYLSLAYEALPEEIYNAPELKNLHIMYKHQIRLNDIVKCFYTIENDKHYISIKSKDEKTLHAVIELY